MSAIQGAGGLLAEQLRPDYPEVEIADLIVEYAFLEPEREGDL